MSYIFRADIWRKIRGLREGREERAVRIVLGGRCIVSGYWGLLEEVWLGRLWFSLSMDWERGGGWIARYTAVAHTVLQHIS